MAKIQKEDLLHGAALTQIAEHEQFTAINAFGKDGKRLAKAFVVNNNIGMLLKYRSEPAGTGTFNFNLQDDEIADLAALAEKRERTYLVLVCATFDGGLSNNNGEICALAYESFLDLMGRLDKTGTTTKSRYLYVECDSHKSFRVYVNMPGRKQTPIGRPIVVARKAFPNDLFE